MSNRVVRNVCLVAGIALAASSIGASADQTRPDAWITTKVKMALLTEPGLDAIAIDVDTFDGRVTLHGQVESASEEQRAVEKARAVEGVEDVRNLLAVVPEAAKETVEASDAAIRQDVVTVLERDAALEASDIEVESVNDGIVVLAGTANTLTAHRRALEDARSVEGVRHVASEIQSPDELGDEEIWYETAEPGTMDHLRSAAADTWITSKAKVALMTDPGLSPTAISVDTRNAVVTLFGIVESERIRERAGARILEISGVKGVENELQVVPDVAAEGVVAKDDEIREAVERRLGERASLEGADLDVEVKAGVARLKGTVASHEDRMTVLGVARATKGVRSVIDDLQLAPTS